MKRVFAYIRVSTVRQGKHGSSLQEQRAAIEAYARRQSLEIVGWFEEQETAAKRGRRVFARMLAELSQGKAAGVVIHKIDRSARNLHDWADLGALIDHRIEVHFAHESIDLTSRGGRLSADIQAVVAADYIRNLKEEGRKGFYGRLKQGVYPLPAPLGYHDEGGGKPKTIDSTSGPLIRLAFEQYATGAYSLESLGDLLRRKGLRNRAGGSVTRNGLSIILNNEFYTGTIHIKSTGERFPGAHEPLVGVHTFERVQDILQGRVKRHGLSHHHIYRRAIRCGACERVLIPETQKGHAYYRCHKKSCKGTCVRETVIDEGVRDELQRLTLPEGTWESFLEEYERYCDASAGLVADEQGTLRLKLSHLESRLARLTDAYVDHLIEQTLFEDRKAVLLRDRTLIHEELTQTESGKSVLLSKLARVLELLKRLRNKENLENPTERCDLIKSTSSNLALHQKSLVITWDSPFYAIAFRSNLINGEAQRATRRTETEKTLFQKVLRACKEPPPPPPVFPRGEGARAKRKVPPPVYAPATSLSPQVGQLRASQPECSPKNGSNSLTNRG